MQLPGGARKRIAGRVNVKKNYAQTRLPRYRGTTGLFPIDSALGSP